MDADRFDALTRALDTGSRRSVLGAAAGIALGMLGSKRDLADVDAKKKRRRRKKKKPSNCRSVREYCAGICEEGSCDECCSKTCGFTSDIPDLVCCVAVGQPCPSNCKKNQNCPGCCGSSICVSNGTCF
jgi:hypothetical protein